MAKDPFDEFLDQLDQILNMSKGGKATPQGEELPEDIEEKLEKLTQEVANLNAQSEAFFKELGITNEQFKQGIDPDPGLSEQEIKRLKRAEFLSQEFEKAKRNVSLQEMVGRKQKKDKDKTTIKRKKKFRRVGGRKDWKPL